MMYGSKDVFAYMRTVAAVNQLGKNEDSPEGTLSKIYDAVKFIDGKSADRMILRRVVIISVTRSSMAAICLS